MQRKRLLAIAACIALTFSACGQVAETATEETSQVQSSTEETTDVSNEESADFSKGTPWVYSCVVGTLQPEDQQSLKDDFYQAVNYEFLAENQDSYYSLPLASCDGMQSRITNYINDDSNNSELDQNIKIFYNQAADADTLAKEGITSIQKYLDMIDGAKNIDELNEVFASKDYPFDAFFRTNLRAHYMNGNMVVGIFPRLFAVEEEDGAKAYRNYPIDFSTDEGNSIFINSAANVNSFIALGYSWDTDKQAYLDAITFESSYGKDAPYSYEVVTSDYDKADSLVDFMALEDIESLIGDFPLREVLTKEGRDKSELYYVGDKEWLSSFAEVYTDDNIDTIKLIAKLELMQEATPYTALAYADLSTTLETGELSMGDTSEDTAQANAYTAVTKANSYGQAIGDIYKNKILSNEDYDRLYEMTNTMIDQYRSTFEANTWMDDTSKENALKKLDTIKLNILEPEGGYISFEGVEMKTADEGATLLDNYLTLKQHFVEEENKMINTKARAVSNWLDEGPATMNACYEQDSNSINIYPGIVCEATYRADMSDEELYGSLGDIVCHEISHAFDYAGSRFNAYGEPKTIFSDASLQSFLAIQEQLTKYYDSMSLADTIPVDGKYIIAEAGADLGGMEIVNAIAQATPDFDYDTYYKAVATLYALAEDPSIAIENAASDNHPANHLRVNSRVLMFDSFYDTYDIQEGDGMYLAPEDRIIIW